MNGASWQTPPNEVGDGAATVEVSKRFGLEGVVAKRGRRALRARSRSAAWLKVKNHRSQEFVVGGWQPGEKGRTGSIGSLLIGYYDGDELRYAGKVGSGLSERDIAELEARLRRPHLLDESPFSGGRIPKGVRFVEPLLVVQVRFTEWTSAGNVRHPTFLGRRTDKDPREVVRETAGDRPHGQISSSSPTSAQTVLPAASFVTPQSRASELTMWSPRPPGWSDARWGCGAMRPVWESPSETSMRSELAIARDAHLDRLGPVQNRVRDELAEHEQRDAGLAEPDRSRAANRLTCERASAGLAAVCGSEIRIVDTAVVRRERLASSGNDLLPSVVRRRIAKTPTRSRPVTTCRQTAPSEIVNSTHAPLTCNTRRHGIDGDVHHERRSRPRRPGAAP